jgi:hypothetical protein
MFFFKGCITAAASADTAEALAVVEAAIRRAPRSIAVH